MDIYALDIYFYVSSQKGMVPILHAPSNGTRVKANQSCFLPNYYLVSKLAQNKHQKSL